jgi:hypothetical protein
MRPSAQRGKTPVEQALERSGIPLPGTIEQFNRCLWRQRFSGHLRCWQGVDGEHHTFQNNEFRPQIQQSGKKDEVAAAHAVDRLPPPLHTPGEDATIYALVIACLLLAAPVAAQTRVYTNADLGKPITWSQTPTAEELASLKARQFVAPPFIPDRPSLRVIDGDPTHGPFGPFELSAFTQPLDPNWRQDTWGYWGGGFPGWDPPDRLFRGNQSFLNGGRFGHRQWPAAGNRAFTRSDAPARMSKAAPAGGSSEPVVPGRGGSVARTRR